MATAELLFRINAQAGDFKSTMAQVRSELKQTGQTQTTVATGELSTRQQLAAAQSLQRQRSAALIAEWKRTERAAADLARGVGPVKDNLQKVTDIMQTLGASSATLTGPLGGVAGRLRSLGTLATEAGGGLGVAGVAAGAAVVAFVALTVATAVVVKEFASLIVSTAEWQGRLHDLSQQTEVSVETLSGLEVALRRTGGGLDTATQALIIFQTKLADAQDPASDTAARFEALGITATDTETAFRQALLAVAAMPDGFEKVDAAAELFGRRGAKQLLAAIKETGGDLDKLMRQLKAMGLLLSSDAAKAADEFNDELLTVQLQIRALTAELVTASIPQILAALRETSKIIAENKASIELVGSAIGVFVRGNVHGVLLPALRLVAITLKEIETAWRGVQNAAEVALLVSAGVSAEEAFNMVQAREAAAKRPSPFDAGEAESGLGGDLTSRRDIRESQERLKQAKFEADELKRISADKLAQTERDYQQGKITREKERDIRIAALNAEKTARLSAFQAEEVLKQQEMAARQGDVVAQRKLAEEIDKIRQDARNLQSQTSRAILEEEDKARDEQNKRFIEHIENQLALRLKANEAEIKLIETRVKTGEVLAQAGADAIERIENQELEARRTVLRQELQLTGLDFKERDRLLQRRGELEQEATETQRRQAERRKQITRDELEHERSLLLDRLNTQLRLGTVRDNAQIASVKALAVLRIRTEEEAERAILQIRLAAIDREADAVRARLTAAKVITDPKARQQAEAQLNADLSILQAERKALEEQGERDTEAGRQRDIESKRRQAGALRALDDQIVEGDLDRRRRELELLTEREGLNARTIALFRQLTLDEEAERHKRIVSEIEAQRAEANAIDVGGKNKLEIEKKYNELREQENQRFHDRQDEINRPGGADVSGSQPADAFSQFDIALKEHLSGDKLTAAQAGLQVLATAFQQVGQAVGEAVHAFVLFGNAGGGIKKFTATLIAEIARMAAVQAVWELAQGFAMLAMNFFWPDPKLAASATAHFHAAAIYGGIAAIAAVAGRAVAGDAFKQTAGGTGASGSSGSRSGSSSEAGKPTAIDVNRNVLPQTMTINLGLREGIVAEHFKQDYMLNGPTRLIIKTDGQG